MNANNHKSTSRGGEWPTLSAIAMRLHNPDRKVRVGVRAGSLPVLFLGALLGTCPLPAQANDTVFAWGGNFYGETDVPAGLSGITAIAAGSGHTVALKADGSVVAWGANWSGQTTIPPAAQSGVIAIAAGGSHTVALKADGSVVAWGDNGGGQTTVPPAAQSGVTAIAAGGGHTVALKADSSVVAWGYNGNGQTDVPAGLSGVTAIAAGSAHTVAAKTDGSVVAWGRNDFSQTDVPAGLSGVIALAAGDSHTVALKANGSVVAWGFGGYGQTTTPPAAQSGVTAIAAGTHHTVALKANGSVVAWGYDFNGESDVPTGLSGVTAIAAGGAHTVVITDNPPPTADAGYDQTLDGTGATTLVTLDGSASSDPNEDTLTYEWSENGSPIATGVSPTIGLAPGWYFLKLTVTNSSGASSSDNVNIIINNVTHSWSGVLQPINADGSSVFKAGRTVPVKFQLTGASAGITDLVATLSYAQLSGNVPGPINEATTNVGGDSGNVFRYDASSGQYIFNGSTKGLPVGSYRLYIDLGDGVERTVDLALR